MVTSQRYQEPEIIQSIFPLYLCDPPLDYSLLSGYMMKVTNPTAAQSEERRHKRREDEGPSEVRDEPVVRQQ